MGVPGGGAERRRDRRAAASLVTLVVPLLLVGTTPVVRGFTPLPRPAGRSHGSPRMAAFWDPFAWWKPTQAPSQSPGSSTLPIPLHEQWVQRWNRLATDGTAIHDLLDLLEEDATWNDYGFYRTCQNKRDVEQRWRLQQSVTWPQLRVDDSSVVMDAARGRLAFLFDYVPTESNSTAGLRGCAFLTLNEPRTKIRSVDWVVEGTVKGGEASLRLLTYVSPIIDATQRSTPPLGSSINTRPGPTRNTLPERYYDAWNRRDMEAAVRLFTDDVVYDDTAFDTPFRGKDKLQAHLLLVANNFPKSFQFVVDDIAQDRQAVAVRWHVENKQKPLPFTQGCSVYRLTGAGDQQKIASGIDFVAPGPLKTGGSSLLWGYLQRSISTEPVRLVPILTWITYMYVVFLSDGILPGANALALEPRTWQEVLDLSLNFFFVSPLLHLPFSPVVHPMLEGVFNLLLSWAAMFAGFLSDDRRDKPNLFPMLPAVAGMQFLTSAFLLPYLAVRSPESRTTPVSKEELSAFAQVCESPLLGASMGLVGAGSIAWFFLARMEEFGSLPERWSTFMELLSIDRVGSSFIVDLVIFALFQGWLVDDDLRRRGQADNAVLGSIAKYVPFFGMAAYLIFRPPLKHSQEA